MLFWIIQLRCIFIFIWNTNLAHASDTVTVNKTLLHFPPSTQWPTQKTTTRFPSLSVFNYDVYCKFQANGYDCENDHVGLPRFYFDMKMQDCKSFQYGQCHEVAKNVFTSLSSCQDACRSMGPHPIIHNLSANVYCRLQPDFGECNDYQQMYYYDVTTSKCQGFSFSGCGGNQNRFSSILACQSVCNYAIQFT